MHNSQSIFVYILDSSDFLLESGLWYFWFWFSSICLLLVYSVSAAGCDCFDSPVNKL